ncbi:MAG: HAMP domain-containing sensor histidine kinase, partial [Ignavibacteriaceae bacterium]
KDGLFLYKFNSQSIEREDLRTFSSGKIYSQIINSIARMPDGTLWLGIWQGGLVHYNPAARSIETFSAADGMAGISVQGILYDEKQNHLWLSTFDGISMLNLNNNSFYNYYLEDGIRTLKYAEGAYLKSSGGLFLFGGLTGITYFDPAEFSAKSLPPKVFISEFKVGDNVMQADRFNSEGNQNNLFSLDYTQNNISIQYSGIQYDNPDKNRFAYRLLNFSDNWQEVKNVRSAYYYDLPPGTFTFQVKAANSNGLWSAPVSMSFEILPPWYRTWWAYAFYILVIGFGIFTIDRTQRRRLVRKERERTENERKEKELEHAKAIEKAYTELKATQSQLIHSEKMASLGELTAGIAHEIKNPLNFVNNFSEISSDLIEEINEELENNNKDEVSAILKDLKQNLEKINIHGKRADSIVKGMLLHSRGTTGEKTLTDINDLLDQYVNLAYHGMRAQDKEFNITMEKDYDKTLKKINEVPQDISRVFLNIINNACYAAYDRKKKSKDDNFSPELKVSTKQLNGKVEIRIGDNGNGIPKDIIDKIFQPFFTTKPTGEGTGLGLSLSYDIVTKVHGGELKVETNAVEGTWFIILIPSNNEEIN